MVSPGQTAGESQASTNGADGSNGNMVTPHILEEVILVDEWERPVTETLDVTGISQSAADALYSNSSYTYTNVIEASTQAEIELVIGSSVFRDVTNQIYQDSRDANRELGILSVYNKGENYYLHSTGSLDPDKANRMYIEDINLDLGRHVFDWHPHPWGNTEPSPADMETSYRRGAPGVVKFGGQGWANTIFMGVCKEGKDC